MCATSKLLALLLFVLFCLQLTHTAPAPDPAAAIVPPLMLQALEAAANYDDATLLMRPRRQFDLRLSAEHDDKEDETKIALEAIANLWRSNDGNTQVEGSAKVIHRANTLQSGNSYSAHLHVHHDYKK